MLVQIDSAEEWLDACAITEHGHNLSEKELRDYNGLLARYLASHASLQSTINQTTPVANVSGAQAGLSVAQFAEAQADGITSTSAQKPKNPTENDMYPPLVRPVRLFRTLVKSTLLAGKTF